MKREPKVVWSSGTFLTPQLFEAQERYFEGETRFRSSLTGFARWGVSKIEIDSGALATGVFRLTGCAGIFENGFSFSMPETDSLPRQREFSVDESGLEVSLAIPARNDGTRNISNPGGPTLRFMAQDQTICSDAEGLEEKIQVAQPCFKLLFGTESTDGFDTLPIARVVRGALDPSYIPPCLNAAVNRHYWDQSLKKLLDRMTFVSTQLSLQRSNRSELLADFADSDIRRFWVLHIVNRAMPELKHIHLIRHCHPEDLYRFLLRLGGALFTFWAPNQKSAGSEEKGAASQFGITDFPPYKHHNLGDCLPAVTIQLEEMLKTMVYRKRRCEPMNMVVVRQNEHFKAKVSPDDLVQGTFYIAVRRPATVATLEIEDNLKVVGAITSRTAGTLAGLQLALETKAPADCAQQDGFLYYRVIQPSIRLIRPVSTGPTTRAASREDREQVLANRRFEVWQDIQDNGEIHLVILNPANIPNVQLLIVGPESGGYAPLPE